MDTLYNIPQLASAYFPVYRPALFVIAVGLLILFIARTIRYSRAGIFTIDRMTEPEYEEFLIGFFNGLGYSVESMGKYTEDGISMVVNDYGRRTAVQAVRRKKRVRKISIQTAIEKKNTEHCSDALVLTNHGFSWQARRLARKNKVMLWGRRKLTRQIFLSRKHLKRPSQTDEEPQNLRIPYKHE